VDRIETEPAATPVPVKWVAGFQTFKAAYLLFLFVKSMILFRAFPGPGAVSGEQLLSDLLILLLPAAALYSLALGWGLWRLRPWARRILLLAIVNCWMIGAVSWNGLFFGSAIFLGDLNCRALAGVLVLDLLVYGCLQWYPGVSEAFGARDDD